MRRRRTPDAGSVRTSTAVRRRKTIWSDDDRRLGLVSQRRLSLKRSEAYECWRIVWRPALYIRGRRAPERSPEKKVCNERAAFRGAERRTMTNRCTINDDIGIMMSLAATFSPSRRVVADRTRTIDAGDVVLAGYIGSAVVSNRLWKARRQRVIMEPWTVMWLPTHTVPLCHIIIIVVVVRQLKSPRQFRAAGRRDKRKTEKTSHRRLIIKYFIYYHYTLQYESSRGLGRRLSVTVELTATFGARQTATDSPAPRHHPHKETRNTVVMCVL